MSNNGDGEAFPSREPEPGRKIAYALRGKIYELPIIDFIILQTYRALSSFGDHEPTPEEISDHTGEIASILVAAGWFSQSEYVDAWTDSETENIDEELKELLEEEWTS